MESTWLYIAPPSSLCVVHRDPWFGKCKAVSVRVRVDLCDKHEVTEEGTMEFN